MDMLVYRSVICNVFINKCSQGKSLKALLRLNCCVRNSPLRAECFINEVCKISARLFISNVLQTNQAALVTDFRILTVLTMCSALNHQWNIKRASVLSPPPSACHHRFGRWRVATRLLNLMLLQHLGQLPKNLSAKLPYNPWEFHIYLLIYHKNQPNLGKYTNPMDGIWMIMIIIDAIWEIPSFQPENPSLQHPDAKSGNPKRNNQFEYKWPMQYVTICKCIINIHTYIHTCTLDLLTSCFNNCIQQNSSIPELPATKTDQKT